MSSKGSWRLSRSRMIPNTKLNDSLHLSERRHHEVVSWHGLFNDRIGALNHSVSYQVLKVVYRIGHASLRVKADGLLEQHIDIPLLHVCVRSIKHEILPVTNTRHQLNPPCSSNSLAD